MAHLLRDLENLKKEILHLAAMVEDATRKAILTVVDRRGELAEEVIAGDREVDDHEVRIEVECLKILALHQPVASRRSATRPRDRSGQLDHPPGRVRHRGT